MKIRSIHYVYGKVRRGEYYTALRHCRKTSDSDSYSEIFFWKQWQWQCQWNIFFESSDSDSVSEIFFLKAVTVTVTVKYFFENSYSDSDSEFIFSEQWQWQWQWRNLEISQWW